MYFSVILIHLIVVFSATNFVQCRINILGLMAVPSQSHHIWNRVLMNELAAKGYNVTVLSCDLELNTPNLTYIHLEETYNNLNSDRNYNLVNADESPTDGIWSYYLFQYASCKGSLKSKGFQHLLNYPDDFIFDLIVFDFTMGPCLLGFADKFKYPPVIGVTAFNNPPFTNQVVGGHKYYAYIPYYSLNYGIDMNFFKRIYNAYMYGYDELYRSYIVSPKIDKWMKEAFRNSYLPNGSDLEKLSKLILVNSHPSVDFPEPTPPNLIQVGGLQIQDPKPLPEDLETYINSSTKGFVLFSLGTNVRSDALPLAKRQIFLDAMEQLPEYNFLWKFESNVDVKLPRNVKIHKWLPQTDLLGHQKIKAFITHAGLLSTHEAVWFGVPMVAIPFLADQHRNSFRIVDYEIGKKILFADVTIDTVKSALKNVLEEPRYKQNILKISKMFKDRELKPLEKGIWWIEYILRNPDCNHLESPTLKLGYIRSNLYDIILFFVILFAIIIIMLKYILVLGRTLSSRANMTKDKKNT